MNWQSNEMSYGLIEELEWPDLWDDYERASHAFAEAHDSPRKRFGLPDDDSVCLQQQLRILDPKGECLARLRRAQESLGKAECALRSKLELLPDQWHSTKTLYRILGVLDLEQCTVASQVASALCKMHVDDETLGDLVDMSQTRHGFPFALEAIVRVGTLTAREALLKIAKGTKQDTDLHGREMEAKRTLLSDAAVAISVRLNDRHVISVLVNRLTAAYANVDQSAYRPAKIVGDILRVMESAHAELTPKLLEQLAALGGAEKDEAPVDELPKANSRLGIEQAIIARDLRPIRDAARKEIQRRKLVSLSQ